MGYLLAAWTTNKKNEFQTRKFVLFHYTSSNHAIASQCVECMWQHKDVGGFINSLLTIQIYLVTKKSGMLLNNVLDLVEPR